MSNGLQLDPQTLAMMQGAQGHRVITDEDRKQMADAERKQIKLFSVQMAVQAGVTDGAEGIVEAAKVIASYITGE